VISQIGGPTMWVNATSTITAAAVPALSMTRDSQLGGTQTGYKAGDLISFMSTNHQGQFSQQAAIVVDAASAGRITQWHFLWGGLYDAGDLPAPLGAAMVQDNSHSYCGTVAGTVVACGTASASGATLTPAWSGWSLLNTQTISNRGAGYVVGDIVTLSGAGAVANQSQLPRLIVEGTTTSGGVSEYDWLDYGSFGTLPTTSTTLTDNTTLSSPSGLTFDPVAWTQGPFATTINTVTTSGTVTNIVLTDNAPFPGAMNVQSFYYGDDDYLPISMALASKPASALVIPAGCGTTQPLTLSQDSSPNNANPALVGGNARSSGIYAFAAPLTERGVNSYLAKGAPVLSRVLSGGLVNSADNGFLPTSGGGFRNIFVEGSGVPEGYGYFGLAWGATAPSGYKGPTAAPYLIPTSGAAVEIDAGALIRIDNVHVADGGIGRGNSAFQCGLDESNPTGMITGAAAAIAFTNSRLDSNAAILSGATNPDFAVHLGNSCAGSVLRNLTAYDGIKADVLQHDANILSQIHVNSDAVNTTTPNGPAPAINWATITTAGFGLAGAADYGLYVVGNTALAQIQCDIANVACVFTFPDAASSLNAGNITDTQMRCGGYTSVPTGALDVELSAGVLNTTVSGAAAAGKCAVPQIQLVVLDGPADPSSSLCNNSNALVAGCTGYQGPFAAGQFYTQPAVNYGTVALSGNVIYAIPFFSPASGGPITKLALQVVSTTTISPASLCEVGVYNAVSGAPASLIVDAGTIGVTSTITSPATITPAIELAPQTLYFLAVGCNGSVSLEGVVAGGGLSAPLTGAGSLAATTTLLSNAWTFMVNGFPSPFTQTSPITITAGGPVPNVYAGP
jgi:hypothetical protein